MIDKCRQDLHEINFTAAVSRCVPDQNHRVFDVVVDVGGGRAFVVRFVVGASLESTDPLVGLPVAALEEEAFEALPADGHCQHQYKL